MRVHRRLIALIVSFVLVGVVSTALWRNTVVVDEGSIAVTFDNQNMITSVMQPGTHFPVWTSVHVKTFKQGYDDAFAANVPAKFEGKSDLTTEVTVGFSQEDAVTYLNAVNAEIGTQLVLTDYDNSLVYTAEKYAYGQFKQRLDAGQVPALQYVATATATTLIDSDVAAATTVLAQSQESHTSSPPPLGAPAPQSITVPTQGNNSIPFHGSTWTFMCTSVPVTATNEEDVVNSLTSISNAMKVKLYPRSVLDFATTLPCRLHGVKLSPPTTPPPTTPPTGW